MHKINGKGIWFDLRAKMAFISSMRPSPPPPLPPLERLASFLLLLSSAWGRYNVKESGINVSFI